MKMKMMKGMRKMNRSTICIELDIGGVRSTPFYISFQAQLSELIHLYTPDRLHPVRTGQVFGIIRLLVFCVSYSLMTGRGNLSVTFS